ncbi:MULTISPECIES: sigma-54-dependent transcriptional regulator [unclassified Pedobacter]|uniref:sigma-54-dependent transcriptional regulator n=1 Tax=unclassified Pedobacter TaxID=2628915 RepID=UPI00142277C1|nr:MULTISPECIES: sigma-54 dependent transcriptional regulator [unclassified Pedobacter]NII84193.1 two-component system response regulator HydG [Pedobacter sp. SG908]NMN38891.1 two-component system response regulator HydG [Pedobacter sp. SG918]
MKKKVLIVDDEISIGLLLSKFLTKNGFEVSNVTTGRTVLQILEKERFDLVLCDYRLDDTDGKEILIHIKENYPATGVIIITGYSDIKLAVELIKLGAFDYIVKPLYPDEILNTINKALETQEDLKSTQNFEHAGGNLSDFQDCPEYINGESDASVLLLKQIQLVAPTGYTVILTGKSGTGKECVAKTIHLNSARSKEPFIAMDCGSLTKDLAASEFFGHEKGAFTGAAFTKIGHFEQANGGTLFLDEIGNLSYEIQAILLRAVQERKIKRIGSTKEIDLDVRLIVATNENLVESIKKGSFREDLYHRFNEFSIHVPSLKHRDNDILIFAEHFLATVNKELNKNIEGFSDEVKKCLLAYHWPGNVRELKNVIRRIALLTDGDRIETHVLPLELGMSDYPKAEQDKKALLFQRELNNVKSLDLRNAAKEAEYTAILEVLKAVNFNKTKAAKILNIDRKTLYNKIKFVEIGDDV